MNDLETILISAPLVLGALALLILVIALAVDIIRD